MGLWKRKWFWYEVSGTVQAYPFDGSVSWRYKKTMDFISYCLVRLFHGQRELERMAERPKESEARKYLKFKADRKKAGEHE